MRSISSPGVARSAAADGLGLAAIALEDEQARLPERQRAADALERERRAVRRAVVYEHEID